MSVSGIPEWSTLTGSGSFQYESAALTWFVSDRAFKLNGFWKYKKSKKEQVETQEGGLSGKSVTVWKPIPLLQLSTPVA